jgi:hypothetical protein
MISLLLPDLLGFLFLAVDGNIWLIFILGLLPLQLVAGMMVIADSKVCEYNSLGCTVTILSRQKFYSWDEIRSKYLDDFKGTYFGSRKFQFGEGIYFSTHEYKRPKWLDIELYCELTHPFSSFYVLFPPVDTKDVWLNLDYGPLPYSVDKTEFLSLLAQWGVTLTDVRGIDVREGK